MQEIKVVTIEHIRHTYLFDSSSKLDTAIIKKLIDKNKVTPDNSVRIQEDIISSVVIQND